MLRNVLVVDDEPEMTSLFADFLAPDVFAVQEAHSVEAALSIFTPEVDVVITDLNMPHASGMDLLRAIKQQAPHTAVIVMTAFGSIGSAIEAMREGAADFLTKPLDMNAISLILDKVLSRRDLEDEVERLREHLLGDGGFHGFVGDSPHMRQVFDVIARVSATESSVLVWGETGTGKELAAAAVHQESARREGPFVSVNLSAVPEALLESQFFGHEKGAFTDASAKKDGLLVAANGGSLFLDEIGDMPAALQAKLLRVLQERKVRPIGSVKEVPFDVRIISATHKDLQEEVAAGRFREDLFYRLNVIDIELPPLRERGQDILHLAHHFLSNLALRQGTTAPTLSTDVVEKLLNHSWPGNVRELQNVIERAVALCRNGVVELSDLPKAFAESSPRPSAPATVPLVTVEELERHHILAILEHTGGNKVEAARILGLNRRTLYRKMEKYGEPT